MPYAKANDAPFIPALIADMNASDIAFSVHDGDIKDGSSQCTEDIYADAIAMFDSLETFGQTRLAVEHQGAPDPAVPTIDGRGFRRESSIIDPDTRIMADDRASNAQRGAEAAEAWRADADRRLLGAVQLGAALNAPREG